MFLRQFLMLECKGSLNLVIISSIASCFSKILLFWQNNFLSYNGYLRAFLRQH